MSVVAEWDDVDEDDALERPETFYGAADKFAREFLVVTYGRAVSPKGEFRWDPRCCASRRPLAHLGALSR